MTTANKPPGYHTITPYLKVDDPERLLAFLQTGLGATLDNDPILENGRIAHAELSLGDSHLMMSGSTAQYPAMPACLYIYLDAVDAAYARALAAGGTSIQVPTDQFYGDRTAGVRDPCGGYWWLATHQETLSPEELARRAQEAHA